ncbi:hypothetical protein ACNAUY_07785 [Acinetobacter tibetensis]|uniref:hypothetical protein n=1 Tax=Acinetobacter tibetensis TaxID=2943497 RepID=UPI003A4D63A2
MIFYALIASNVLLVVLLALSMAAKPFRPTLYRIFHRKYSDEILLALSFTVIIVSMFA